MSRHTLTLLPERLAIIRLDPSLQMPPTNWALGKNLLALIRTPDEITLICDEKSAPTAGRSQWGMRALKLLGPLDFAIPGVLASLTVPLAAVGITVFAISTFDTEYLLVKAYQLESAIQALRQAGHMVVTESTSS